MITGMNATLNQYSPTFVISNIVGGQTLVFDPIKKAFVNGYANGTSSGSLATLSDVQLNQPGLITGQVLTWNGPNNWTNKFVDYNSLTNAPLLSPVATLGTLSSLSDVNTLGLVNGDTLVWNTSTGKWVVTPVVSGSTTLSGLTDVNIVTESDKQVLYFDATTSTWKNANLGNLSKSVLDITSLKDVNSTSVQNGYLQWNSTGTSVNYVTTIPATSVTGLSTVATSGNYIDLSNKPVIPTATSQLINDSLFLTPTTGVTQVIAGHNITVTPNSGVGAVTIASTANIEKVIFQYTPGAAGNFVGVTPVTSAGITATIIDPINCVVHYTFTGYITPPVAIMTYGQNVSNNTFAIKTNGQLPSNNTTIAGGGSTAAPDLLSGNIGATTPLTLQTRMSDTGASAGFGQRAYLMILFKF